MKLPFSLFLALRYLKPKRSFTSVVTVISVLGVLLPVAVLIIVISVMAGFGELWREKILGFNAHLTVSGYESLEEYDELIKQVGEVPGVIGAAPFIQGLALVNNNGAVSAPFIRGIDPAYEEHTTNLKDYIVAGKLILDDEHVVIGKELAKELHARVGDELLVYSPQSLANPDEIKLPEELIVGGIFEVGMYDIDLKFMMTSLDIARELTGIEEGVNGLQVMIEKPSNPFPTQQAVADALGGYFTVYSWVDLNRQLFTALRTEKNMMFFILTLLSATGALMIMNTLLTVSFQKTHEIGLMKAVGFQPSQLMGVFIWYGLIMGLVGTTLGVGLGLLILKYRNDLLDAVNNLLGNELLPASLYQLGEIPSITSTSDLLIICGIVIFICITAACLPAWRAGSIDPVEALRYE